MRRTHIFSHGRIYSAGVISVWVLLPLLFLLCIAPQAAASAAAQGLRVAGGTVVPSLLPMMLLCRTLLSGRLPPLLPERPCRRLFGVPREAMSALLAGLLGGYPLGAGAVTALYRSGQLTRRDAERALRFCNNSGPAFFLGVVAEIFGTKRALALYAIHAFSALVCGVLTARRSNPQLHISPAKAPPTSSLGARFSEAVGATAQGLLQVTALITLCFALRGALEAVGIGQFLEKLPLAQGVVWGALELSGGIVLLDGARDFVGAAFLLGWGGLCVQLQAAAIAESAELSARGCLGCKALHGLLSALLARALMQGTAAFFALVCALLGLCAARCLSPLPARQFARK